eukprot:6837549-Alexandrium_andersonii.AAC.1
MEWKRRVSCAAETHAVDVLRDVNDHRMTVATLELDAVASQVAEGRCELPYDQGLMADPARRRAYAHDLQDA